MRIGIVGEDARQRAIGDAFMRAGWQVQWVREPTAAFPLVFPMPVSADGVHLYGSEQSLADWFAPLGGKIAYGGRCSEAVRVLARQFEVRLIDHFEREEEVILNVIPTVEGALQLAMSETPFTIHGSTALVCGFGRIGKFLSRALKALGAEVTVSARKPSDFAWCQALGYKTVHTDAIASVLPSQQLIFNTVPALLFDGETLEKMAGESLLIDLASTPGGVDFSAAAAMGKKALQALGLPAKVAPRTAGEIICKTIITIHQEEENTRVR